MKQLLEPQIEMLRYVANNDSLLIKIMSENHWEHIAVKKYINELIWVGQYDDRVERSREFLNEIRKQYLKYIRYETR